MTESVVYVTPVEPAALFLRHPLGVNLDWNITLLTGAGAPQPVAGWNPQMVLLPRSKGGMLPRDMSVYDAANGIINVKVPGTDLQDIGGYNIEVYRRADNAVPGDPPLPVAMVARGTITMDGSAFSGRGPLSLINVPVVTGPPGPPGPQGATGQPGDAGAPGLRGSVWFTGTGDPNVTGVELVTGDMYLDTVSGNTWRWEGSLWAQQ